MLWNGFRVWAADPHQYGPGKIHAIDNEEPEKTLCGRYLSDVPGKTIITNGVEPTCKACIAQPRHRQRRAESEARYERQQAERQRAYLAERAERRREYAAYLLTPQWKRLRAQVLERADGLCEGCRKRRAVQVHHLTYRHVKAEFLWELVAVCMECHDRAHEDREE